jgi:hypothetical protein
MDTNLIQAFCGELPNKIMFIKTELTKMVHWYVGVTSKYRNTDGMVIIAKSKIQDKKINRTFLELVLVMFLKKKKIGIASSISNPNTLYLKISRLASEKTRLSGSTNVQVYEFFP